MSEDNEKKRIYHGICQVIDASSGDEMKVEDVAILHLSDLHIHEVLNRTLYRLLEDIKNQLLSIRKLIIVVTGDLACASKVSEASDLIVFFFRELKIRIPSSCAVIDVEITPGNHDVKRPLKSNRYNGNTYKFNNEAYRALGRRIYDVFGIRKRFDSPLTLVKCGQKKICFLRVDSSWHTTENELFQWMAKEDGNLDSKVLRRRYGRHAKIASTTIEKCARRQAERLRKIYEQCVKDYSPSLTIAFSHFPLTWLAKSGNRSVKSFLAENGLAGVDIWMCGHTHAAQMFYNNDNNHATTMLMTGVGRPDYEGIAVKDEKVQLQRYSIYLLSFERNVCSVQVRSSRRGGGFGIDDEFRSSDAKERGYSYSCLPLKSDVPGGYIRLHAAEQKDAKGMFIDGQTLDTLQAVSSRMNYLNDLIRADQFELYDFFADFLVCHRRWTERTIRFRFMKSYAIPGACFGRCWKQDCTAAMLECDLFKAFLKCLGGRIVEAFTKMSDFCGGGDNYVEAESFKEIGWRVHFRKYCGRLSIDQQAVLDDQYVTCVSTKMLEPGKKLPWGGVLEKAMNQKDGVLVFSVANVANHIPTKWSDFLSAIPLFAENECAMNRTIEGETVKEVRPLLSYAISMRLSNYGESVAASKLLYILEYLKINTLVSRAISDFLHLLDVDVKAIMEAL